MKLTAAPLLSALFLLAGCGSPELNEKISFLPHPPVIDGQLDAGLEKLKKRDFNYIWQFDNPVTDTVPVTYRMAYTPTHLYLYIEAEADSISFRSRGFINGDGFKLLLGIPQPDSLTDEYYDMVFSASKDKGYWARKRIWIGAPPPPMKGVRFTNWTCQPGPVWPIGGTKSSNGSAPG